jgi:phosphonopyruvate decarboxylase
VKPANFLHVVLNNGVHESVGGHRTAAFDVDLTAIARGSGYVWAVGPVVDREQLSAAMKDLLKKTGPCFLEIRIAPGSRSGLGRPREAPRESKKSFMERLRGT